MYLDLIILFAFTFYHSFFSNLQKCYPDYNRVYLDKAAVLERQFDN